MRVKIAKSINEIGADCNRDRVSRKISHSMPICRLAYAILQVMMPLIQCKWLRALLEIKMRNIIRLLLGSLAVLLVASACGITRETQVMMEVTREVTREVTVVVTATAPNENVEQDPASASTEVPTQAESTPDPFPEPVNEPIVIAEQAFENGRMFYIQPRNEIWVLINNDSSGASGVWSFYDNTWEEGQPESDPALIAPQDGLVQPIRGFGKLWRENSAIQEALGWALDTEYGYWTDYTYYFGGEINSAGEYVPDAGRHEMVNRDGATFVFDERDGTWERVNGE